LLDGRRKGPVRANKMAETSRLFQDLVIAMLDVNLWTLERAASLANGVRDAGLADLAAVRSMGVDEFAARLANAGYKRGSFMEKLFASRMIDAAAVFDDCDIQRLRELQGSGEPALSSEPSLQRGTSGTVR
jgi:hypothetical protein